MIIRVLLLKGLQGCQTLYNKYQSKKLSKEEEQTQQALRVYATAIVFGFGHWGTGSTLFSQVEKSIILSLPGVSYGYLMEEKGSFGTNVFAHGMHNLLNYSLINDSIQNPPLKVLDVVGRLTLQNSLDFAMKRYNSMALPILTHGISNALSHIIYTPKSV